MDSKNAHTFPIRLLLYNKVRVSKTNLSGSILVIILDIIAPKVNVIELLWGIREMHAFYDISLRTIERKIHTYFFFIELYSKDSPNFFVIKCWKVYICVNQPTIYHYAFVESIGKTLMLCTYLYVDQTRGHTQSIRF